MENRHVFILVCLTLVGVLVLSVAWEFVFDHSLDSRPGFAYKAESESEHWVYVFQAVLVAAVALIAPALLLCKAAARQRSAEQQLNAMHDNDPVFKAVMDNSPAGIFLKDTEGRFLFINKEFEGWLGRPLDEFEGKTVHDFYPEALADKITAEDRMVLETRRVHSMEMVVRRADDMPRTLKTVRFPILDSLGEVIGVGGIVNDITERKQAQDALRRSQSRFRDFAQAASDRFWETDTEMRFTWVSDPRGRNARPIAETIIGKTHWKVADADLDTDDFWRRHQQDLQARRPFREFEYPVTSTDGTTTYWSVSGIPVFDEEGVFQGYRGTAADVTERRQVQEQLSRLGAAIRELDQLFLIWDSEDRLAISNKGAEDLNRAVPGATDPGITFEEHMRAVVAKGLVPQAAEREEAWLADRIKRHKNPGDSFEIMRQNDTWLLMREHRLPDGGTVTHGTDITKQKRTENALRESEERFQAIVGNIPAAVYRRIHHADGHITLQYLSPGASRYSGLDPDEAMARPEIIFETIHPEDQADYQSAVRHSFETLELFFSRNSAASCHRARLYGYAPSPTFTGATTGMSSGTAWPPTSRNDGGRTRCRGGVIRSRRSATWPAAWPTTSTTCCCRSSR